MAISHGPSHHVSWLLSSVVFLSVLRKHRDGSVKRVNESRIIFSRFFRISNCFVKWSLVVFMQISLNTVWFNNKKNEHSRPTGIVVEFEENREEISSWNWMK